MERRSGTRRTASLREVRLPSADVHFPNGLTLQHIHTCPLTLSLPLSALGGGGAVGSVHAVGDGSIGTEQVLWGGGRSVWGYVIFRPLEVRRHLVNVPHEVRQ